MRPKWTFAVVSTALFMVVLDNLVVTTALPSIRADLGATIESLQWTVNAYTLTFAVLLLTGAALGDRFGRKRMFVIGVSAFTVASAAAALAPTTGALIAARAIQGAAAASVLPLTLTLLSEAFPAGRRGLVLGLWSGISGLAVAIGPLVGGAVVDGISWHWIFWINVPIGIALVPLAIRFLTESHGPAKHLDLPGLVLGGLGLLGVVYGIVRGNELGWASHRDPRLADRRRRARGRVRRLGAARAAPDAADALLPLAHLRGGQRRRLRHVLRRLRLDLPAGAVPAGHAGHVPAGGRHPHAAVDRDADARSPRGPGILSDRIGSRPLMATGLALQAGALAWLASISRPDVAYASLVLPFAMAGAGMALVFAPSANAVLGSVDQRSAGQASGATNAIRELGGVMGIAVLASVFSAHGSYASPQAYTDGMVSAVWVGAAVLAAGALVALLIPRVAGRVAPATARPRPGRAGARRRLSGRRAARPMARGTLRVIGPCTVLSRNAKPPSSGPWENGLMQVLPSPLPSSDGIPLASSGVMPRSATLASVHVAAGGASAGARGLGGRHGGEQCSGRGRHDRHSKRSAHLRLPSSDGAPDAAERVDHLSAAGPGQLAVRTDPSVKAQPE